MSGLLVATPALAQPVPSANQYGPGLIGAPAAWAAGYSGQGVTVTVADSGIDPSHPAFAGKIDPRSRSFVLAAPGTALNPADINDPDAESHGTHVGGIIGASGTSGAPGIAYNANLVVLKMIPGCPDTQNCSAPDYPNASASAIDYFTGLAGTKIYNASYGPTAAKGSTIWPASMMDPDEAASAQRALAAGKIIVAATGNDRGTSPVAGANPNGLALYPFARPANANAGVYLDGGNQFDFSGLLNQPGLIIAVTSVGQAKTIAPYAQTCGVTASWCVAGPGGDQDVDAGIYSTLPGNNYGYLQGTSMATPAVSGALAVLQQAYPGYTARDLANVLFATAENVGGKLADNATYGYGLIRLDRAVAGPTSLAANAVVAIPAQQVTYWSQPLTTSGGFTVNGPGTLMVAGRTTAAGDVTVAAGALGVDGTLTMGGGTLRVGQGAMLAGIGRVVGNVAVSGTLNAGQLPNYADVAAASGGTLPAGTPLTGTSPGTMTFQGNVTLAASATTRANIDGALQIPGGPGTYDKIIVTGAGNTFTAGGALVPVLRDIPGGNNTYTPAPGTMFQIITAQDGAQIAGQFASLVQPAAGLGTDTRLDVVYGASAITLNVTPLNFKTLAAGQNLNPNVQALASALDKARPQPGVRAVASEQALFDDLYDNSIFEDKNTLAALAGEGLASHPMTVLSAFTGISGLLADRQAQLRPAGAPSTRIAMGYGAQVMSDADGGLGGGNMRPGWNVWAQGMGRWSQTRIDNGIPGADDATSGLAVGADRIFSSSLAAGAAFSFSSTATDSNSTYVETDVYAAAAYMTWTPGNWVIDARMTGGPVRGDSTRVVTIGGIDEVLTGKPEGWGLLAAADAGYAIKLAGLDVEPYAGLTLQTYNQDAYWETGDVGLDFRMQYFTRSQTALGARLAGDFDIAGLHVRPQADLAWTHDLGDAGLNLESIFFDEAFLVSAARPGRDAARVRAGFSLWQDEGLSLFVNYGGEFRANMTSHQVNGGLRLSL
ncbi:MAG: autotransporter domain-containing protein [Alphaproteobacteria bacterium]|nr:autotransporter domain-containing protein [Alphaproteobacteria bacterium]